MLFPYFFVFLGEQLSFRGHQSSLLSPGYVTSWEGAWQLLMCLYRCTAAALTSSLSSMQEITRCLSQAVEGLARAIPSDLEQEKAMLVLAMLLTKKVANQMPSLLQRVFSTTVNYISQHFHNYIVRMVSAIQQLCSSERVTASLFAGPGYSLRAPPDSCWFSHNVWGSGSSAGKSCWYLQAPKADMQREGRRLRAVSSFCSLPWDPLPKPVLPQDAGLRTNRHAAQQVAALRHGSV